MPDVTATHKLRFRSLLFAPGSDERKLRRAMASAADAVVADLEDSVLPELKEEARDLVVAMRPPVVRINAAESPWFAGDLAAIERLDLQALILPKAVPESVRALGATGPPVIATIETAQGLRLAYETASEPRVTALMLGAADLATELALEWRLDELELLYARSKLVADSAAAGAHPPVDVVHLNPRDLDGLETSARLSRSLGFGGKACIHPDQVEVVNRVFSRTAQEIEQAYRIVAAFEAGVAEGKGAVVFDGKLVDRPVVERARQILSQAGTV